MNTTLASLSCKRLSVSLKGGTRDCGSASGVLLAALLRALPTQCVLDYPPRKVADDCLVELRWLYYRRDAGGPPDLAAWPLRWQEKYPTLCAWVEENIEQTLTFYRLP